MLSVKRVESQLNEYATTLDTIQTYKNQTSLPTNTPSLIDTFYTIQNSLTNNATTKPNPIGQKLNLNEEFEKFDKLLEKRDPETKKPVYNESFRKNVDGLKAQREALRLRCEDLAPTVQLLEENFKKYAKESKERDDALAIKEREAREKFERDEEMRRMQEREKEMLADDEKVKKQLALERGLQGQADGSKLVPGQHKGNKEVERLYQIEKVRNKVFLENSKKEGILDKLGLRLSTLRLLRTFFDNIVRSPEKMEYRRFNIANEKFQRDVIAVDEGKAVEFLVASGFELTYDEKFDEENNIIIKQTFYLLKEPELSDLDGWSAWFEKLKATLSAIDEQIAKASKG